MSETNKTCQMQEAMMAYLYKEASADEARRFEAHLAECSACRQELAGFERVREQLQHWQVSDLPVVRVVADLPEARRSFLAVLKELFAVMPLWVKATSVAAIALIVMAVTGTSIRINRDGFSLNARMIGTSPVSEPPGTMTKPAQPQTVSNEQIEQLRANLAALVSQKIADSERQQKEELRAQLVSLQSDLQAMRSTELAKIIARVQQHHSRLQTIERDLDRREGSDLTDILFSEMMSKPPAASNAASGGE